MIEEIRHLTDINNHVEAYALGCKMLGNSSLSKIFTLLGQIMDLENGLSPELRAFRDRLYKQMMDWAKHVLPEDQFDQFYRSF